MRSLLRLRLLCCLLPCAALATPAHAAHAAPPAPEAGEVPSPPATVDRYTHAQDLLEQGNVVGAAELWESMLAETPESQDTHAAREAMLLNAIDARMEAYRRQVSADGELEPLHLLEAQIALRRYLRSHAAAYGDSRALGLPVQERAAGLALALAEATPPPPAVASGPAASTGRTPGRRASAPNAGGNGNGLLVGGIGLGVLGFAAALTMIPLGAALGRNAENIYTVATTNATNAANTNTSDAQRALYLADAQEAERAGRTANRVAIAGGIISPLMLGAAAAMIVFGLQRRRAAEGGAFQHGPQVSPEYAGWSATARF